jgi:hypothetical protein
MKTPLVVGSLLALAWATAMVCTPVSSRAAPVILDPRGNLTGDPTRAFMDIVETTIRTTGADFIIEVQMAAPFPVAGDMTGGKRFDVIWFIDIDRDLATGQSPEGNDYNIHLFLDEHGWHYLWFKVSAVSQRDGITILPSAFRIEFSGDRATLTFPQAYLPSRSFEMWAWCISGNAPSWVPITENPLTSRARFDWDFSFTQPDWTVDESADEALLTVLRQDDNPDLATLDYATVDYATVDGTAKAGLDYTAVAGTLVFPPGKKSATISIPILDDGLAEGNEQLTLRLVNPTGSSTLGQTASVLVTIIDNDPPPPFSYSTDAAGRTITDYLGLGGTAIIPETINGLPVTAIGSYAFLGCATLTNVTIPSSVTSIGEQAFGSCTGLTSITLPNSVTSIGNFAFLGCNGLTSVTMGNNVTSIGHEAFRFCANLISVTIPNSVTSIGIRAFGSCTSLTSVTVGDGVIGIGDYAFSGCVSLARVTIGNGVTGIGNEAFSGCTSLMTITVDPLNPVYSSVDGVWFNKSQTLLILCPTEKGGSYTIPDSVISIGAGAFSGCASLTRITIPDSVTSIGDAAFSGCINLTSVAMGTSVTTVGNFAFSGLTGLTSFTIPKSVTAIDYSWFSCRPAMATITVSALNPAWSSVDGVLFDKSQTILSRCPEGKTGNYTIPNSVTNIRDGAFSGCTLLTSITIPDSVTSIGESAFSGCASLIRITIPDSVTSIGAATFSGCTNLTSVAMGTSVTNIGNCAFCGLTGLTNVAIPNSVTSIGTLAFRGCTGLTSVTIPDSVRDIGDYAFTGCTGLTSVTIPNGVTNIGNWTFEGCSGLTNITIPGSVTAVGNGIVDWSETIYFCDEGCLLGVFSGCTGLMSATILNGVTSIGAMAFSGCTSLTSVTIPDSITGIGSGAFSGCTSLTSVTIPNSVTSVGDEAFSSCTSLTSVSIGSSVTSIGAKAFSGCIGLTSVTIPNSVTSMGAAGEGCMHAMGSYWCSHYFGAFDGCASLRGVYFEGNVPDLDHDALTDAQATVFYLPGATGWGTTFGGCPTAPWVLPYPVLLSSSLSFGLETNGFGFTISWATNNAVVVEAATDLANPTWTPVATNTLTGGTSYFSDPQWAKYPRCFYRIRSH